MKTIAIANQKGGIGKTTTACAIAGILKSKKKKVLLIDTDMQCNSTAVYKAKTEDIETIYDVILASEDERVNINDAIQHTEYGDIIASDRLLADSEAILGADKLNGLFRFQEALSNLNGYDYVIVDTNPMLNLMLYNVLIAVDYVVIPVTTDRFGTQGLSQFSETLVSVKKRYNPNITLAGLLIVKYKSNTRLGRGLKEGLDIIAKQMGTKVFKSTIRESVKVQEAQQEQVPLNIYAPSCTSTTDYKAFVTELLKTIG